MRRAALWLVILTFAVAVLGGWLGVQLGQRAVNSNLGLDQVLHHDLSLTKDQERTIEALEASYDFRNFCKTATPDSAALPDPYGDREFIRTLQHAGPQA